MTAAHPLTTPTTAADIPQTVERMRRVFDAGTTRPYGWRRRQLEGLERLLTEQRDALAEAIDADLRRGRFESAMFDIVPTVAEVRHAIKHLRGWMRPQRVPTPLAVQPGSSRVLREPLGVALIISPWNYPVHLALAPLVAALAAGNCAVLKPSELTPTVSAVLARLLPRYLDGVAVVEGGPDETMRLIDQGLDHVFFTGSPGVGRIIAEAAAKHLTPVTLELGGKSPAVVTRSSNLRVAARRILFGKLINSGQTCIAPDYVLVERSVRDEFLGHLDAVAAEFTEHRALPVLSAKHAERLTGLLAGADGQVLRGGPADADLLTMPFSVVVDPAADSALMTEEIFGPILPVVTVDDLDEAIARIRSGSRPLAAYLFTRDGRQRERFLARVSAGGVAVNHTVLHLQVPGLPFGGVGTSGTGSYHGRWGFEAFSHRKGVLRQSDRIDLPLLYPPYVGRKRRFLEKAF